MEEFFKALVERAQYYEHFELFRDEKRAQTEFNREWRPERETLLNIN